MILTVWLCPSQRLPFDIIQTWFGAPNGWGEKDGKLVPEHQTEEYLEALNWMRKLCEEGLIKKDFPYQRYCYQVR